MVSNSSKVDSESPEDSCVDNTALPDVLDIQDNVPDVQDNNEEHKTPKRKLYFINEIVEWELTKYIWTGCTDIQLRDQIMSNATELIRQIIRKQGLHTIYPGQEESSFADLLQTAWVQIERTLYKYRSRPHCRSCYNPDNPAKSLLYTPSDREYGIKTLAEVIEICDGGKCPYCSAQLTADPTIEPLQDLYAGSDTILYRGMSKVFNMWSQIARTVILAYIKKEGRDRKNSTSYITHLGNKSKPLSDIMQRFLNEAKAICQHNEDHLQIIDAIEWLIFNDDRPHDGTIGKLVEKTGLSRSTITQFMRMVKLRSFEFTDSPINKNVAEPQDRKRISIDFDED
jgi:hypothetical protein